MFRQPISPFKLLIVIFVVICSLSSAQIVQNFNSIYSTTTQGNIVFVSNAILTCSTTPGDIGAPDCVDAQNGASRNNNLHKMIYIDIDGDPSTFNSSSADFTLAPGANVLFAGLFWGARSGHSKKNEIKFKADGAGYSLLTATTIYKYGKHYHAYTDVTSIVQAQAAGTTVSYFAANIRARRSTDRYGGWTLVVVVEDSTQTFRNMTVYNGYARIRSGAPNNNLTTSVSGFLTPPSGAFSTEVGTVVYEGDRAAFGDSFRETVLSNLMRLIQLTIILTVQFLLWVHSLQQKTRTIKINLVMTAL